ncbi:MAG: hypothetical protein GY906_35540 [bacterium]|nr:hypothetical protein [bacterium]
MGADWNVEDALNSVLEHIDAGALVFSLHPDTAEELRDMYRKPFTDQKDEGVEWDEYKIWILFLSVKIGAIAAKKTADKLLRGTREFSLVLDKESVFEACLLVAEVFCRRFKKGQDGDPEITGGFCPPDHLREFMNLPDVNGMANPESELRKVMEALYL